LVAWGVAQRNPRIEMNVYFRRRAKPFEQRELFIIAAMGKSVIGMRSEESQ